MAYSQMGTIPWGGGGRRLRNADARTHIGPRIYRVYWESGIGLGSRVCRV